MLVEIPKNLVVSVRGHVRRLIRINSAALTRHDFTLKQPLRDSERRKATQWRAMLDNNLKSAQELLAQLEKE